MAAPICHPGGSVMRTQTGVFHSVPRLCRGSQRCPGRTAPHSASYRDRRRRRHESGWLRYGMPGRVLSISVMGVMQNASRHNPAGSSLAGHGFEVGSRHRAGIYQRLRIPQAANVAVPGSVCSRRAIGGRTGRTSLCDNLLHRRYSARRELELQSRTDRHIWRRPARHPLSGRESHSINYLEDQ